MKFPRDVSIGLSSQGSFSKPVGFESLAPLALDLSVVIITLTVIFVLVRLYSNYNATRGLGCDDLFCVIATVLLLIHIAMTLSVVKWARHNADFSFSMVTRPNMKKLFVISAVTGPMFFFAKTSLFLLYYRVFAPNKPLRYIIIIGIGFCFAVYITNFAIAVYFCSPHSGKEWDYDVFSSCSTIGFSNTILGAANAALDICMLGLPIPVVLRLQLPKKKKIGVLAMCMTGLLVLIASTFTLVYTVRLVKSTERIWNGFEVIICEFVETGVTIMCGCIPAFGSFSKAWAAHSCYFASLRSHFFSRLTLSKSDGKSNSSALSETRIDPFQASTFKNHPRPHQPVLFGYEEHRSSERYPLNRTTTEVHGAACVDDIENGIIMKSVTVLQSST